MTHDIIISLASNHDQKKHLREAREALAQMFSAVTFTEELWTEPHGKRFGAFYVNQLAFAQTELSNEALQDVLKQLERQMGRTPELRLHGVVPIDLDLLLFDGLRFHERDWERPYVARLLESARSQLILSSGLSALNT